MSFFGSGCGRCRAVVDGGASGGIETNCAQGGHRSRAAEDGPGEGSVSAAAMVCGLVCDRHGVVLSRQLSAGVSLAASVP